MSDWVLEFESFDPAAQGVREALCTLGNGYMGLRGAFEEASADGTHYPGCYIAGCFNRLNSNVSGRIVENEDLVNIPNWLALAFRIDDGDWIDLQSVEILDFRHALDMRCGVLSRMMRVADQEKRITRIESRRFVSMDHQHLAGIRTEVTPENWSGRLHVRSALDGRVRNEGVARYRNLENQHLAPMEACALDASALFLKVRTVQSDIRIAQTARTRLYRDGTRIDPECATDEQRGYVGHVFTVEAHEGQPLRIEKIVATYTSKDPAISECAGAAIAACQRAEDFDALFERHRVAWQNLWEWFDISVKHQKIAGKNNTDLILRLHLFHLLQVVPRRSTDPDVGVPARGLHGEAYRGHIFWDELFVLPTLNFRLPEATRALLMYRYNRLNEARALAQEAGLRGALYPWQSGSTGREESQKLHLNPNSGRWLPDNSSLQRHVNAAIAFNVWQYFQVTRDMEFMCFYGAEMLFEIARLWASLATLNEETGRYEIHSVMGPDEYHDGYPGAESPGLNNNAYTNVMAAWTLLRALELLDLLPEDRRSGLSERLGLSDAELAEWDAMSRRLHVPIQDGGIISQFDGYEVLEEFDWAGYRSRYDDIQRLDRILEAEGDTPNRFKASKQADVLMLFYLFSAEELAEVFERLGHPFDPATIPKTIDYYAARTSHGSTLSSVVHSWVFSRLDRPRSWELFLEALRSDIEDIQGGTTAEGVHLGAMAGTVDIVQRCYTGLEIRQDVLWFNPRLPDAVHSLCMKMRFRGHTLELDITPDEMRIAAQRTPADPIRIGIGDKVARLSSGETLVTPLAAPGAA